MKVDLWDILDFQRLDMNYNHIRILQAKHNELETRCIGSGKCCKVALKLPIAECANIAYNLKRQFHLIQEDKGDDVAQEWWDELIQKLKDTFNDESFDIETGETDRHCAFYNNGCTIYEYRPFVCRAYGVIFTVDAFCPRKRLQDGEVELFTGGDVKRIVKDFVDIFKGYGKRHEEINFTVFMPLGILHFLLPDTELAQLRENTDEKFWKVMDEYSVAWMRSILEDIPLSEMADE